LEGLPGRKMPSTRSSNSSITMRSGCMSASTAEMVPGTSTGMACAPRATA